MLEYPALLKVPGIFIKALVFVQGSEFTIPTIKKEPVVCNGFFNYLIISVAFSQIN